jgi:hypothetical protein
VLIEIYRDRLFGWCLSQARCVDNQSPPQPVQDEISFALRQLGVHVGRDAGELSAAISRAARGRPVAPIEQVVRGWFGG